MSSAECEFMFSGFMDNDAANNDWFRMTYSHLQDSSEYKHLFIDYLNSHNEPNEPMMIQALSQFSGLTHFTYDGITNVELNCLGGLRVSSDCEKINGATQHFTKNAYYYLCQGTEYLHTMSFNDQFSTKQNLSLSFYRNIASIYAKCTNITQPSINDTELPYHWCSHTSTNTQVPLFGFESFDTLDIVAAIGILCCVCLI
eukprot:45718_1